MSLIELIFFTLCGSKIGWVSEFLPENLWSRETGSAVPSHVSLLISILRLNMVLTYRIPPDFRGGVHLFI